MYVERSRLRELDQHLISIHYRLPATNKIFEQLAIPCLISPVNDRANWILSFYQVFVTAVRNVLMSYFC